VGQLTYAQSGTATQTLWREQMKLSKNTVLITGGSRGIGLEMARQLSRADNQVIVTGRNEKALAAAAGEIPGLVTIQSDAGDPAHIKSLAARVVSEFPATNVLINNAGIMWNVNLQDHDMALEKLTGEVDINVKGPIQMIDALLPHLKNVEDAAIVNVSSGLAFVPLPISAIYSATKAALHSYTQSLRVQLGNTNIRVFELMPPATQTELMATFDESDMKGIAIMAVDKMVETFIRGLGNDQLEIRPGQANQMRFMSRFFPNFILKQLSKPVAAMHQTAAK
jgi:uncharacterized oxidoreductase